LVLEQGSFSNNLTNGRKITQKVCQVNIHLLIQRDLLYSMEQILMEVWKIVVCGCKIPATLSNDEEGKKNYYSNARDMNVIQGGLVEFFLLR
jgi:hypothetical protein